MPFYDLKTALLFFLKYFHCYIDKFIIETLISLTFLPKTNNNKNFVEYNLVTALIKIEI